MGGHCLVVHPHPPTFSVCVWVSWGGMVGGRGCR